MPRCIYGLAICALILIAGCSHANSANPSSSRAAFPSPSAVRITPPAPGLAPQLAAFSGTWQGGWTGPYGTLPARLIVERIDAKTADVVYVYAALPKRSPAGWFRAHASVLPFGQIRFAGPVRRASFTFTMRDDDKTVAGTYQLGTYPPSTITMTKVRSSS